MRKRIFIGMIAINLMLSSVFTTVASDGGENHCQIESEFTNGKESEVIIYPMMRGSYLLYGRAAIGNPSIGYVATTASTYAKTIVPKVAVEASLQQYNNGKWTNVAYWSGSATNKAHIITEKLYKVARGYYYRVYSVHNANGESTFGATSGIYIA